MNNETKKDYLEIPMEQMSGCFHNNTQKLDIYNLTKNEMKRICLGLELLKEERPKDRIVGRMLREYTSYLKNYK